MAARILVVDDHDVVRQGVMLILRNRPDWQIVGEATDGIDALAKIQSLSPDLVILDISMPRKDGLEVLADLQQMKLQARVLVLTMHDSKELGTALQKTGACGYVIKTQAARDLVHAVQDILDGNTFFPSGPMPSIKAKIEQTPKKQNPGMFRIPLPAR
jgi:two-component system, NarL family, response regulator NreC